jgi:hypothetical protein
MLDSLERLEPPSGGWKVVAVDNGSTDGSLEMLRERATKLPMTVLNEPHRGKNVALNTGLAHVEGEIIALMDDDIILPPEWLVAIEKVANQNPCYDIFGGAIYPVWEEPPPDWVLRRVPRAWFGWTDFPEGPIEPNWIWGGSMAVRTPVLDKHKFVEHIGPNGSRAYAGGSEIEFTMRVGKLGHRCWHFHTSPVGHIVRPYQFERIWLLQRAYNTARGCRRLGISGEEAGVQVLGYPLLPVLRVIEYAGAAAIFRLLAKPEYEFAALRRLRYAQGDFAEQRAFKACARRRPHSGP